MVIVDGKEEWISRSIVVSAFIFASNNDGKIYVLANKRGVGTPSNHHKWNVPTGYLDYDETLAEGSCREIWEETGIRLMPEQLKMVRILDTPHGKKQNVAVRFCAFLEEKTSDFVFSTEHMEPNEVEDVQWIPITDINSYKWAFGNEVAIREVLSTEDGIKFQHKKVLGYSLVNNL
jgi:8-oxo-dGTP diphosphatase